MLYVAQTLVKLPFCNFSPKTKICGSLFLQIQFTMFPPKCIVFLEKCKKFAFSLTFLHLIEMFSMDNVRVKCEVWLWYLSFKEFFFSFADRFIRFWMTFPLHVHQSAFKPDASIFSMLQQPERNFPNKNPFTFCPTSTLYCRFSGKLEILGNFSSSYLRNLTAMLD